MPSLAASGPPNKDIAEDLAKKQREIAVSEFFERNRQVLGYDSPTKSLITAVKEGVENSVEHDEPVLVRVDGTVRLVTIGGFIDRVLAEHTGRAEGDGADSTPISGLEVLAYDDSSLRVGFKPASMVHRHPLRRDLFEIELTGGRKVSVTGAHSVFALRAQRIVAARVEDLREGDYVVVPNQTIRYEAVTQEVDLRPWLLSLPPKDASGFMIHGVARRLPEVSRDWKRFDFVPLEYFRSRGLPIPRDARVTVRFGKSRLPVIIPVTTALLRFLGLYAAEGTRLEHKVTLSFGSHETALIDEAQALAKEAFGAETRLGLGHPHKTAVCVNIHSTILSRVLRDVFGCGDRAWSKRLPDLVLNVPRDFQEAFLEGYIAGDGHRSKGKTTMATVSPRLASGISFLLALCGRPFSVGTRAPEARVFPGGHKSQCREAFYLYLYDEADPETGGSPLFWLPVEETGLRDVVRGFRPLNSYNVPAFKDVYSRPHFTLGRFADAVDDAEVFGRQPLPEELQGQRRFLDRLLLGDIGFLRVRSVRRVTSPHPFVYDFSVPGSEKFLGGRGVIFLHNSLDACEESEILPEIGVEIRKNSETEFTIIIEDNGPGIVKKQVPLVFAKLLYGSRFFSNRQTRGQQGLGISGAIMYGQITTGKPAVIRSKTAKDDVAYQIQLRIDTRKNKPELVKEEFVAWERPSGTRVEIALKGRYIGGKQSVAEYIKSSAIVNPHARITFRPPEGDMVVFERVTEELPRKTVEIKPHPYGIELGTLLTMAKETDSIRLSSFLQNDFSRISSRVAKEICDLALVPAESKPKNLALDQAKALLEAVKKVKIMAPESDCLAPIGERLIKRGLKNVLGNVRPEFYAPPLTRDAAVHSGHPFQVEVGIVFGGDLPADQPVEVLRFANRVPLLYQAGACATTQAVANVDWRRYGLEQRGGQGVPYGPAIILVHIASIKVPYTSEAKEAIAPIPELLEETELALKECGRRLKTHLNKKERKAKTREKFDIVQKVLPQIAAKSAAVVGKKVPNLEGTITKIMGVVWVEPKVEFTAGVHHVSIEIHNFTSAGKKLNLHVLLPRGATLANASPKPYEIKEDGKVSWELKRIGSVEREMVTFEVAGLDKDELDDPELFASGISPELVIGAEPLPGDWDLNYHEFETEEEKVAAPAAETETEVDYDEAEEALPDD